MLGIGAVMNVVIARSDEYPLQPSRSPGYIHMHPIILNCVEHGQHDAKPPGRNIQQRECDKIRYIDQELLRDCGPYAAKPIHVTGRVMPFVNTPNEFGMH